jgi:hypothetical protein
MNIEEAEKKTNELDRLLQAYGGLIEECFIDDAQKLRWEDFKIEVMAIADSEISFARSTAIIEANIERNKRANLLG